MLTRLILAGALIGASGGFVIDARTASVIEGSECPSGCCQGQEGAACGSDLSACCHPDVGEAPCDAACSMYCLEGQAGCNLG